jgi:hypothetical protein
MVTRHEMAHISQIRNLTVLLPEAQDLGPIRPVDPVANQDSIVG